MDTKLIDRFVSSERSANLTNRYNLVQVVQSLLTWIAQQRPSYPHHSSRMRSEQYCLLELLYTDAIASYLSLPHNHWWHGRGMTGLSNRLGPSLSRHYAPVMC